MHQMRAQRPLQPRFYMAINLKTAALLGISLSDAFRANEVRE
jgi:hypothetical protein